VRTTLKKGFGQTDVDGDGDGRGLLLPGALSTMERYRQPERRRTALGLVGRILLGTAAAVVMIVAAFGGGAYLFVHQSVNTLQELPVDEAAAEKLLKAPLPDKPTIALVIGYDRRWGEQGLPSRSDTLILLRADPNANTISMLSFPRDLRAEIHCPGALTFTDKINAAYSECGAKGSLATVRELTGLPVNYLVTVDFRGFKQVVDRLDGVWIDVDHRYFNRNVGTIETNYANIDLKPGYQRLNGQQALDYVRYRHTDSDLFRNARQQAFVRAIKDQVQSSVSLLDLPKIVNAITSNVRVGRGGGRDFDPLEILQYAHFAYRLPAGHFFQTKIENLQDTGDGTNYYVVADQAELQRALAEFVSPDVEAPEKAASVVLGRRIGSRKTLRPRDITVTVLNGNAVEGSAATAREALDERGFDTLLPPNDLPANAPRDNYFRTTIYWDPAQKRARAAARTLANVFGNAVTVRGIPAGEIRRLSNGAMTVAVVGKTFHGRLAPAPEDRTPKKQPPVIRKDPAETRDLVRDAQRRTDFRLMVPTVLERSSDPDTNVPIRTYNLAGHKSVRLVFRMPNLIDYWGVQQTDWEDAPILSRPSVSRTIKRRRYDLYFSGSNLHMVVLRGDDGATYWVVNTLSNALSNETMLAIAKGLRPVKR
jgi:LCP family protein required for cell wall assembly